MELKDLIAFPTILLFLSMIMYLIRRGQPYQIRRFFFPAYFAKIVGGFALGLIYMYYYGHGDTTAYFRVANVLNEGLADSLNTWLGLIFGDINSPDLYDYKSRMSRYTAGSELFFIRITAICSLLSFGGYYSTVLWFASFSFIGSWFMFKTLVRWYPGISNWLAFSILFIPSVVFWGSGLLKDTLIIGSLGFIVYGVDCFITKKKWFGLIIVLLSFCLLINIRQFMIPILLFPFGLVFLLKYTLYVKNPALKGLAIITGLGLLSVGAVIYLSTFTDQLTAFAKEAKISSNYLYRVSLEKGGSAYSIGTVDGTIQNLFELGPAAIWVSLFRPYPWEANNIVMLFTALENMALLFGTVLVLLRTGIFNTIKIISRNSYLLYSLAFCLFFAFVTGITTFNFGSLARYRIPILPFFVSSLVIIQHIYNHRNRKYNTNKSMF